jgi:hypothetical protein
VAPSPLYEPPLQGAQDGWRKAGLNVPGGQGRQAEAEAPPAAGLYVPAAHERHAALNAPPALGLYVPAAQLEQDDAPPAL